MSENEWYTPSIYLEAARAVMGVIDLDPASCAKANETVQAQCYYTQTENGLPYPWQGRVWCNPPYAQIRHGQSSIHAWMHKLVAEYEQRHVSEAIALIPNDTSTRWFQWLWHYVLCFPSRRIQFYTPTEGQRKQPTFGTCFVYLGPREQTFSEVFCAFGRIVKTIDPPRPISLNADLWQAREELKEPEQQTFSLIEHI